MRGNITDRMLIDSKSKTTVLLALLVMIFFCMLLFLTPACQAPKIVTENPPEPLKLNKILLFPFKDMYHLYGDNVVFRCSLCDKVYMIGEVTEDAGDFLTEQLILSMKNFQGLELVLPSQAQAVMSDLSAGDQKDLPEKYLLIETGRILKTDAVLLGRVFRFKERVGTDYSVESPASVSFDMILINVADGRILWTGYFDETQRTLSENLFRFGTFLKRKGRWITAEQMAASAFEKIFKTFPAP
ncbi:MAG: hypothetical protein JW786_03395 [Desulfobacterales bacterium]|nr:hypothetical protein [Desulfobacterales bacterium]